MNLTAKQRLNARTAVTEGLTKLRAAFPLEARLLAAAPLLRQHYTRVLSHWLRAGVPPSGLLAADVHEQLLTLDAIAPSPEGLGCYPFSARPSSFAVLLPAGPVHAMCALDALAMARLASEATVINAHCDRCAAPLTCRVRDDGGLEHEEAERAHMVWKQTPATPGACHNTLCRNLLLVCTDCTAPAESMRFTLPQATAMANAFFAFQRSLLADH